MKKIVAYKSFEKHYSERIRGNKNLEKRVEERINLFLIDRKNVVLHDHQLSGKSRLLKSFSIAGDLRIIYSEDNNYFYFLDIGTHNQVYT